ncbi:MAG: tetratricopeptide repeat protein [Gammaproteobacteria bacterium]|nr:tetratricopeptide repeat protein [Gammaproteobacteria bacterium]MDH5652689.1 tetratricopeptide repeat protein [Gammaproteobacteria bacterium]
MLRAVISFWLILLVAGLSSRQLLASDFTHINSMLDNDQADKAYTILLNEEDHHLGELQYELLLGRAALNSAHYHEAIFAYERALMIEPNNLTARLGLAIAHFNTNENERAIELFEKILSLRPADNIRKTIHQYLDKLRARQASLRHKLTGEVKVLAGWDSNINSATYNSTVELFGTTLTLADASRETSGVFNEVSGKFNYTYTVTNNHELFSSINLIKRSNHENHFDTEQANLQLGGSINTRYGRLSVPLSYQIIDLDAVRLRELTSLSANLIGNGTDGFYTGSLQYGLLRYPDQPYLDMDMFAVGLGYVSTNKSRTLRKLISVYVGDEAVFEEINDAAGKQFSGFQGKVFLKLHSRHIMQVHLSYQLDSYHAKHLFLNQRRVDKRISVALAWNWWLTNALSIDTSVDHTNSDSTSGLFDYRRNQIYTGFTYRL